jgi:ankyrin repeat protein
MTNTPKLLEIAKQASLLLLPSKSNQALGMTELEVAALSSNWRLVRQLVTSSNKSDILGTNGLLAACAGNDTGSDFVETVEMLLEQMSLSHDVFNRTPLHILAGNTTLTSSSASRLLAKFLEKGGDINAVDWGQNTALHTSATHGTTLLPLLIQAGAKYLRDADGELPIHDAARCGNVESVKLLIEAGCDARSKDISGLDGGFTPLHCAALNNQVDVISYLLSLEKVKVDARDRNGKSAFMISAEQGHLESFKLLLTSGSKRTQHSKTRQNVLHALCSMVYSLKDSEKVREYEACARLVYDEAMNEPDVQGNFPLHYLASANIPAFSPFVSEYRTQQSRMIDLFIDRSVKNKNGETALYRACISSALDICQKLYSEELVMERTVLGRNVLHAVARYNRSEILEWLQTIPAYPVLKLQVDASGKTPSEMSDKIEIH